MKMLAAIGTGFVMVAFLARDDGQVQPSPRTVRPTVVPIASRQPPSVPPRAMGSNPDRRGAVASNRERHGEAVGPERRAAAPRRFASAPDPGARGDDGEEEPAIQTAWHWQQLQEQTLARARERAAKQDDVDWSYVTAVFTGEISGIPSEARAGLTLQELDELGDIPYVERLREQQHYEQLRELGFEDATVPWPICVRTASCRIDRASSPP